MDSITYQQILSEIKSHKGLTRCCLKVLKEKFSTTSEDTLSSIISLEYQKKMKYTYVKNEKSINKYFNTYKAAVESYEPCGIILRMSIKEEISPCLIAKLILTKHLENKPEDTENHFNLSLTVTKCLRDTTLIRDKKLAYEIFLCNLYDDQYSPSVEISKSSLGQQYEIQLYRQISELGLAFRDEEYLRKLGYDKTPDVKLEIPVAVDGFIINWIESKALFGDSDVHKDYIKNQYSSYWNRFGTGLVIYWFGYLETISTPNEKRFIIRDRLPENLMTL